MILSDEEVLSRTYGMKADVVRWMETVKEWGETKTERTVRYSEVPCSLQRSTRKNNTQTQSANEIEYDTVLLHPPGFMFQSGDEVTVTFPNGETSLFHAGEPYFFETHHEVPLYREDEA